MYKFFISALVSLMLVAAPAEAARTDNRAKVTKSKAGKAKLASVGKARGQRRDDAVRSQAAPRGNYLRRTVVVRGKRQHVYQRIVTARNVAPVVRM
ncbi:MAG: peptidase S11, partial [Telluria sp.]